MKSSELGRTYDNGEVICAEGEKGDAMYVIQSGRVKITKRTPAGEVKIATLESGEIFGEMALFDKLPRAATASALGSARVLSIDQEKLFSTISRDPTLVFKLIESMSKRIRGLNDELARLKKEKVDMLNLCADIDDTCNLILERAKSVIKADNGSVMFLDEEGDSLFIRAAFGNEAEPKTKLSIGMGIAGDVMRTGQAELVNNVSMDSRFVPGSVQIRSMMCAPLRYGDHTFGVINLSRTSDELFNLDDFKLLHTLSVYASMAILNARNFSKLDLATDKIIRHSTILRM